MLNFIPSEESSTNPYSSPPRSVLWNLCAQSHCRPWPTDSEPLTASRSYVTTADASVFEESVTVIREPLAEPPHTRLGRTQLIEQKVRGLQSKINVQK